MKTLRTALLTVLGMSLSACAAIEVPSRNAPFELLPADAVAVPAGYEYRAGDAGTLTPASVTPVIAEGVFDSQPGAALPVTVGRVAVRVPRSLKVSEANRYLPAGDIVWREDPPGDRHAQVQAIVQAALEDGVKGLDGPVTALLDVEVVRFHALTEKARYSTGGVHAISFDMALKDPETGALLSPVHRVDADLRAYGGGRALAAMARGETQKMRISAHLAKVVRQELLAPGSHRNARLGLIQMMNKF